MRNIKMTLIVALIAYSLILHADVIELKDGSKLEGKITNRGNTEIMLITEGVEVTVTGDEIKAINGLPYTCDYKAMYEAKAAQLPVTDVDGHFKLALWCEEHKLKDEMNIELERVLTIDPNHEGARQKLGQVFVQGQWRTPEELKKLGYVRKNGRWMSPDEAAQAEGKVTYKGNWVSEEDRKRLEARQFSRYTDTCSFTTHTICELEREIRAIQLLNMWNPTPQQLKQMWAVLNEAEAERQVFLQKRNEIAEEIESAWIALRNEALKGVVDSFDQNPQVEARAGAAEGMYKSLHKGCDYKLYTYANKFMSILTPAQKDIFQNKYCGMCHASKTMMLGLGGREYRGTQAGVDFLVKVRALTEDQFNAQMCDLAEEALKKFAKGPQVLVGKQAIKSGKRSPQDLDAEEQQICEILKRARLMKDVEFERKKFNLAAALEAKNQEERLRIILAEGRSAMNTMASNEKMMGMVSEALFDGALRQAVAAKLGIPKEQQVVKPKTSADVTVMEFTDGKAAFDAMCTMCHSADRINKARKDPVGWRATVDKMMRKGILGGNVAKNVNLITEYLVNRVQK